MQRGVAEKSSILFRKGLCIVERKCLELGDAILDIRIDRKLFIRKINNLLRVLLPLRIDRGIVGVHRKGDIFVLGRVR